MEILWSIVAIVAGGLLLSFLKEKARPGAFGFAICLIVVCVAAGIGVNTGYLRWGKVEEPDRPRSVEEPSVLQYRPNEQLNILVFNATSTEPIRSSPEGGFAVDQVFYWTVNELKRVLDDCSIDARDFWTNRRVRQRTQVLYNGPRAKAAALEISSLLPGNQDIRSLDDSRLWGMHPDRDVVMLLGRDAWYIMDGLSELEEERACPRLTGD